MNGDARTVASQTRQRPGGGEKSWGIRKRNQTEKNEEAREIKLRPRIIFRPFISHASCTALEGTARGLRGTRKFYGYLKYKRYNYAVTVSRWLCRNERHNVGKLCPRSAIFYSGVTFPRHFMCYFVARARVWSFSTENVSSF